MRYGLGLVLLTVVTRLPLLLHPFAVDDERIYAVVGHEIQDGGKPYQDAIERKPPLLFWTYTAISIVIGRYAWPGLHAVALLWVLLTMAGCYCLGRALFDRTTGLVAALLYCIYQAWWAPNTLALNGEVLMNLPLVWAAFLSLRPSGSRLRPELFFAGALLTAGFLLKQPAAIAALPLGIYLLLPGYRKGRGLSNSHALLHALLLALGFFITLGVVALVLRSQGILREAIYWTIEDHTAPFFYWQKGIAFAALFLAICAPLTLGGMRGMRAARSATPGDPWAAHRPELIAVLLWVAVSWFGVAAGGRFYAHYFIQLVPPLAILAGPWVAGVLATRRPLLAGYLALSTLGLLFWHAIALPPSHRESEAGRYVLAHSDPTDRIFVWGQATPLYLEARRRPASRYIATFPLTGYIFGSPLSWDPAHQTSDRILSGAWDNLAKDFSLHSPLYIIDTDAARAVPKYPIVRFPFLRDLVARQYRLVYRAQDGVIYRRVDAVIAPHS